MAKISRIDRWQYLTLDYKLREEVKASGLSQSAFIKANKDRIDTAIRASRGEKPQPEKPEEAA